jgi:toxin ParE1/3/4
VASLRFSRKALADLRAIHDYLAERNPVAARRIVAEIEHMAALLADNPDLGRPGAHGLGRTLIVPRCRYVISYRLDGATVEIRFIFHPRQAR